MTVFRPALSRLIPAFAVLTLAAPPTWAADVTVGALTVAAPWARATPKGAATGAGYLTIVNAGDTADRLTGVVTPVAGRAGPHEMTMTGSVMTMRALPDLVIPPHGTVVLKPGGLHLMLEKLTGPLKQGASFPATLTFEAAGTVAVTFTVSGVGAKAPSPHDGMSMDGGAMD